MSMEQEDWCVVSDDGIEQDYLTRTQAKAKAKAGVGLRAMKMEDAEELFGI